MLSCFQNDMGFIFSRPVKKSAHESSVRPFPSAKPIFPPAAMAAPFTKKPDIPAAPVTTPAAPKSDVPPAPVVKKPEVTAPVQKSNISAPVTAPAEVKKPEIPA